MYCRQTAKKHVDSLAGKHVGGRENITVFTFFVDFDKNLGKMNHDATNNLPTGRTRDGFNDYHRNCRVHCTKNKEIT
jgi:hypothetical protein